MEENEFEALFNFSKEFRDTKEEEEKKLPFHINIIDELHINENGHSRVLTKLLQYQNEKKQFVILQSLLDRIVKKTPEFGKIQIVQPIITQEIARIDLWIKDKNYALIFENKVYDATDQESQICRYIEKTLELGYKDEQIYIIYLSRDGKEPDPQSWGKYKEGFKARYVNLSFKNDILPWLNEDILPKFNNNAKEKYLHSAILQYIDFLEGEQMFRTNSIYTDMNTALDKLISENLKLQSYNNEKEKFEALNKRFKDFKNIVKEMDQMRDSLLKKIGSEWRKEIQKNYPVKFYEFEGNVTYEECFGLCVEKKINGKDVHLYIGLNKGEQKFYCQLQYKDQKGNISKSLKDKFRNLGLEGNEGSGKAIKAIYRYYVDLESVYTDFKTLLKELIQLN